LSEQLFEHKTVLLHEAINFLDPKPGGRYVDCTLGGAGHTRAILEKCTPNGQVLGIDQDENALINAQTALAEYQGSLITRHANFAALPELLAELGWQGADGILFDLGVSSPQLDVAERGFSYMADAPLDMRMDQENPQTAADLVNSLSADELAKLIWDYGEERWSRRIAQFIVEARTRKSIRTTGELVDIIKAAIPAAARRSGPHPAKRTFQALRIAINREIEILEETIRKVPQLLLPGGRVVVISFHSLEDRVVKQVFKDFAFSGGHSNRYKDLATGTDANADTSVSATDGSPAIGLKILTKKPVTPEAAELENNPRARSAKLRAAERISVKPE
jgi:16S rRNA (cytosine1402-N4)-methyltransferase